ncbi:hypothetical protein Trydic_g23484 [Trypoxylus dichotomus]
MQVQKHPDINREDGYHLSAIWKPLLQAPSPSNQLTVQARALAALKALADGEDLQEFLDKLNRENPALETATAQKSCGATKQRTVIESPRKLFAAIDYQEAANEDNEFDEDNESTERATKILQTRALERSVSMQAEPDGESEESYDMRAMEVKTEPKQE